MTVILRAQNRVYADSMHLHQGEDPTKNLIDKVYSLNYLPVYLECRDRPNEHAVPVDHLVGMVFTGSAQIARYVYNRLIAGDSIDTIAKRYVEASYLFLAANEGVSIYFVGCAADYRCTFTARESMQKMRLTTIPYQDLRNGYDWCAGTATDDVIVGIDDLGYHPATAIIRGIDRQSDTCGGIVEVWRWVPADDKTPVLFYREGFIVPRPSISKMSHISGNETALDFTVSAAYVEEIAAAARNRMAEEDARIKKDKAALAAKRRKSRKQNVQEVGTTTAT